MSSPISSWRLDAANTTVCVLTGKHVPELHYFGPALGAEITAEELRQLSDDSVLHASLDEPTALSLCPQASLGHAGSPGLAAHRNGKRFAHRLQHVHTEHKANSLSFQLADASAGIEMHLTLKLDELTSILTINTAVVNRGEDDLTVDWLASATLPLPEDHTELLSQHGRWGGEFSEYRRALHPGLTDISNRHGRTSHEHAPWVMTGPQGFGDQHGEVLCSHIAWSGNASLRIERMNDGHASVQLGVLPLPGELILAPGERFEAPPVIAARGTGINAISHQLHTHVRQHILPPWTRTPRPIHSNSWEAVYFDHSTEKLFGLIDACAELGAERFVLDDGWFGRRRNDTAGLGDWFVDPEVYPDGLQPVVDRVRQHGMQFGLWFEPEMVNPDSALYEQHPEWVLRLDGIDTPLARSQLVLDLSIPEVRRYLFDCITRLVHEYAIDYIKWDMNRDLVLAGNGEQARALAQPPALYQLLEQIRASCPTLEIESCSSGGARVDMGILKHTGRVWTSDNIDPIERAQIQAGFLRIYPPEIMGAHVGHKAAHLTGRETSLHTRAIMALQGQYGFEIDARRLDATERSALAHYTAMYRKHREWLSRSVYYRLDGQHDSLVASMQVADDARIALLTVVAVTAHPHSRPGRIKLAGLDATVHYRVALESLNRAEIAVFSRQLPHWLNDVDRATDTGPLISGELLMKTGLPLPVLPPQSALLVSCHAR